MAVLRRVEMKIDGRDVTERRYILPSVTGTGNSYQLNYILTGTATLFVLPAGKLALQNKWIIYLSKLLALIIFAACMKVGRHGFEFMQGG